MIHRECIIQLFGGYDHKFETNDMNFNSSSSAGLVGTYDDYSILFTIPSSYSFFQLEYCFPMDDEHDNFHSIGLIYI